MSLFIHVRNIILICVVLILAGCNTAMLKEADSDLQVPYSDHDKPDNDPVMEVQDINQLTIAVPDAWEVIDEGDNALRLKLAGNKGERLLVYCYQQDELESSIEDVLRSAVNQAVPGAEKKLGVLAVKNTSPVFFYETYAGSMASEGIVVDMHIGIAWRENSDKNGCHYGLVYTEAVKDADMLMEHFLAILRSIK